MNTATLESCAIHPPLSEREVAGHILAALVRECHRVAAGPHNAFVSIRITADGASHIYTRFGTHVFPDTDTLAGWLVERCRLSTGREKGTHLQPEAATAGV